MERPRVKPATPESQVHRPNNITPPSHTQARSLKLIHTATPDTTKLSCLCRVRFGGVNWIPDNSRLSPTENLKPEQVQSNSPIHTGTPGTTQTGPSCRVWCGCETESARPPDKCVLNRSASGGRSSACLSTATAATQARQAATPSRPTAHAQRRCTPRKM